MLCPLIYHMTGWVIVNVILKRGNRRKGKKAQKLDIGEYA